MGTECDEMVCTYEQILRKAQVKGIDQSLEPVSQMLCELGGPDLDFKAIQIVGTNGKTSTARYLAAILGGEGLKVGLYLSPMFMTYLDQIEVEGKTIGEVEISEAVGDAWQAAQDLNARRQQEGLSEFPITEFELLTAAAALVFSRRGVDVAVLEAGMGGEWDATSAMRSIRTVGVTGIALDHTRILGSTPAQIARNKAAVIQKGRRCVLGPGTQTDPEVAKVFELRCKEQQVAPVIVSEGRGSATGSSAFFCADAVPQGAEDILSVSIRTECGTYEDIRANKPPYQAQNIACATVLAQEFLCRPLSIDALRSSVLTCRTPGRFDMLQKDPLVLVDACHNPQSVKAFLDAWRSMRSQASAQPSVSDQETVLLCAIFADKDVDCMVAMLAEEFADVVVTQTKSPRAMPADQLAKVFEAHGVCPEATFECVEDAVLYLGGRSFVACGSITTAGEVASTVQALRPSAAAACSSLSVARTV